GTGAATGGGPGAATKTALTTPASRSRTTQAPWPVQRPPQPSRTAPASGVAVRVTAVPAGNVASQRDRHSSPGGSLRTVPGPLTTAVNARGGGPAGSTSRWMRSLPASATYTRSAAGPTATPSGCTNAPSALP